MADETYVGAAEIKSQAWKFYFAAVAWPAYLIVLPFVFLKLGYWSVLFMVFPGVYLFTWVGYLMHETWHRYVPELPNGIMYNILSWMLLTDPQIYRILHGFHHSQVNTWEDNEFHPFGFIRNPLLRKASNLLEIAVGVAFLSVSAQLIIPRHPKYKAKYRLSSSLLTLAVIALFLGGLGYASHLLTGAGAARIAVLYGATIWLNSFMLHHSQLVEHGNLIAEGPLEMRNIQTRNLKDSGLPEKIFLFLTHGDSREHVLHHTLVGIYSRPFPRRVPMPQGSALITLKDYVGILGGMLAGETKVISSGTEE